MEANLKFLAFFMQLNSIVWVFNEYLEEKNWIFAF